MMTLMAKPPPPPPPAPAAVPKGARARLDLAESALRLRDEQLQARVVYVDPELQTNAELDAITAEVVEELKALQRQSHAGIAQLDPQEVEIELIKHLRDAREKLLSDRRQQFWRLKIEGIQRRASGLKDLDALNTYFVSDAMVSKIRDLVRDLRKIGGTLKARI